MKHGEKLAPVAACLSALSCLACCLPFGIAAAVGVAGLSVLLDSLRPWLLAISVMLLLFGLWQLYGARGTCQRRSRAGLTIFWACCAVVALVALAPQVVGGFLAGGLPMGATAHAADMNLDVFKGDFNRAAGQTRVIVLLSPT